MLATPGPVTRPQDPFGDLPQARPSGAGIGGEQRQVLAMQARRRPLSGRRKIDAPQSGNPPCQHLVGEDVETELHGSGGEVSIDQVDAGDIALAVKGDMLALRVCNATRLARRAVEKERRACRPRHDPGAQDARVRDDRPYRRDVDAILPRILDKSAAPTGTPWPA